MLSHADNESAVPHRGRCPDGPADAPALDPRLHVGRSGRARWRAGARAAAWREAGRVSGHAGATRRGRRALSSSACVAGARAQRGMRSALPVSRLEDRRRRQHRRQAFGATALCVPGPANRTKAYPCREAGGFVWVWMGLAGDDARIRAAGLGADARHPHQHRQDSCRLQLGAGTRRRDRFRAQFEPAFDRHGAGEGRERRRDIERMAAPFHRQGAAPASCSAPISAFATWRSAVPSSTKAHTTICGSRFSSRRSPC